MIWRKKKTGSLKKSGGSKRQNVGDKSLEQKSNETGMSEKGVKLLGNGRTQWEGWERVEAS